MFSGGIEGNHWHKTGKWFVALYRAHLVPVFGFGENDLMNQAQHPLLRYFQEKFRKFSGVAPVLFYGRGIFQYNFGLLPHRVPLYIVGKSYSG